MFPTAVWIRMNFFNMPQRPHKFSSITIQPLPSITPLKFKSQPRFTMILSKRSCLFLPQGLSVCLKKTSFFFTSFFFIPHISSQLSLFQESLPMTNTYTRHMDMLRLNQNLLFYLLYIRALTVVQFITTIYDHLIDINFQS